MNLSLEITRHFAATPETLYTVWTDPAHLTRWFGVKVEAEARVGGPISFHFSGQCGANHGRYVTLNPYSHIAFTWNADGGATEPDTTVHIRLQPERGGTLLTLRHEGFGSKKARDAHDEGWLEYMELWSMLTNPGPKDARRAAISEVFPAGTDFLSAFADWLNVPRAELRATQADGGALTLSRPRLEARWTPCDYGYCLALAEWGFDSEDRRVQARRDWERRFAALKGTPAHAEAR